MSLSEVRVSGVRSVVFCLMLAPVMLAGCGSAPEIGPTVQVTGKVTLDGEPLSEGTIWFVSPGKGYGPSAPLMKDGSYAIEIEDARIGEDYGVYIGPTAEDDSQLSDESDGPVAPVGQMPPPVPTKYQRAVTSGLVAPIESPDPVTFDFELQSE